MSVIVRLTVLVSVLLAASACKNRREQAESVPAPAPDAWPASIPGLDPALFELHKASTQGRARDFSKVAPSGPAAAGSSSVAERERAALELFTAGAPASMLPVVAVDQGNTFELALRHVVAQGGFDPAPMATLSDVEASDGLNVTGVEEVLSERLAWYEACFIPTLRRSRSAAGSVAMRWSVGPQGNVTGVWTKRADLLADDVTSCVVRHSHGLIFAPPPKGSARVGATIMLQAWKFQGNPNMPRPR